jgi:pimeloyl-ACP methyl ester carboxylesterase
VAEGADVRGDAGTGEQDGVDRAAALLDPDGGDGAELRGHVPDEPVGVVLVLHGGSQDSRTPVAWWRPAVVRMAPFASCVERRAGDRLAVLRLKYRVRGWNGTRQDPVQDARWALDRIRHVLPGVPVVLVGHSMGGRVALRLAAEPDVAGVAALAPWVESDSVQARPGTPVLLVHGSRDRITDPRRTAVLASRLYDRGVDVRSETIEGDSHAMMRDAGAWHRLVRDFVIEVLDPGRTS